MGDGKQSPFGNGKGGSNMGAGKSNNFVTNPRGGSSGSKPRNFVTDQAKPVTTGVGPSPDDAAPAGLVPLMDPAEDPEIGTRALGQNSNKPYKLNG